MFRFALDCLRTAYRQILPAPLRAKLAPVAFWALAQWPERLLAAQKFDELVEFAEGRIADDPDDAVRLCWAAIGNREQLVNAYVVMAKALLAKGDVEQRNRIAAHVRDQALALIERGELDFYRKAASGFPDTCDAALLRPQIKDLVRTKGLALIERGELAEAAALFRKVEDEFPDTCTGLALLYGQMDEMARSYCGQPRASRGNAAAPRRVIFSLSVWGNNHVGICMRYFIPSILSANNLPALSRTRKIMFDIFTSKDDIEKIKAAPSYRELARYAEINLIEFAADLLTSRDYKELPDFKHRMFAGYHHMSIEHARVENADLVSIAPDGIYSDGALTSYLGFVDQGYQAVLITGMKAQAEPLLPILDSLFDQTTQSITLPPRTLVALNAAHVHHDFKRFIMTKGNTGIPPGLSLLFFPNSHGFYGRCFHLFPIVLSAVAVQKDIAFDYFTLDSNALLRIFPVPETWKDIKVVDDSDDGVMLDLAFSYEEPKFADCEFVREQLIRQLPGYRANHFWHFSHRIVYRTEEPIDTIGTFSRRSDGTLERMFLAVSSAIDIADDELADWFEATRPK